MVIDSHNSHEVPLKQDYKEATLATAKFLGNAKMKILHLGREKVIKDVYKTLLLIAQEEDNFRVAPPSLFADEFA